MIFDFVAIGAFGLARYFAWGVNGWVWVRSGVYVSYWHGNRSTYSCLSQYIKPVGLHAVNNSKQCKAISMQCKK